MRLQTFFDNFDLFFDAPNSVAKLREMILQLALQGALLSQDAQDEPASVLLRRIEVAKATLLNGKKAKTALHPVDADEAPYDLPDGWEWTRLANIGLINPRNDCDDDKLASFVPMALVPQSYAEPLGTEMREWGDIRKGFTHFAEGDVVLAKITPCFQNGKAAVMRGLKNGIGAGTTELLVFRPVGDTIIPEFVLLYFRTPGYRLAGVPRMTGTAGQKRVPNDFFAENPFPLPPIEEQKRIVAKVDELMRLCDELELRQQRRRESRVRLNNATLAPLNNAASLAPEEFKRASMRLADNFAMLYDSVETVGKLRSTILQLAVQGKFLTKDPQDEPADVALKRIQKVKEATVENLKQKKALPSITSADAPFGVPSNWRWTRLGEVARLIEYGTSEKASVHHDGVPVFRMNNIEGGKVVHSNLKYVSPTIKDLPRLYLRRDELLFNRTNSFELVGKTGIFKGDSDKFTFASYLIRIRLFDSYVCPDYINLAMNADYFRQTQINKEVTQQCGQANFNGTKLANTLIPLPPLAEQKRIVTKVNQLMALCDELETKLREAEADSEKLMNAAVQHVLATLSKNSDAILTKATA